MIQTVTSTSTLTSGYTLYFIDATNNSIDATIPQMTNDNQYYNMVRIDNSSNTVNIILDNSSLITSETSFKLYPISNVMIMSLNSVWIPMNGYTKDR